MSIQGKRDVNEIVNNMQSWPDYYLTVKGNARAQGDPDKNLALASERARNTLFLTQRSRILITGTAGAEPQPNLAAPGTYAPGLRKGKQGHLGAHSGQAGPAG